MTDQEKAAEFRRKYFGRQDVVAGHFEKKVDGVTEKGNYPLQRMPKRDPPEYLPVSDELILQHISGAFPLSFYVLQLDGTIKFGALDFDSKPGREAEGFSFDDVALVFPWLRKWNIPFRVARSTTNGFHVLFFFKDFYPANRFRAVIHELFHQAGFTAQLRATGKSLPEVFPKQSSVGSGKFGNCLKAEMIETRFIVERNGFVTEENQWVGGGLPLGDAVLAQWEHLAASELVESSALERVIEDYGPPIDPVTPWKERPRAAGGESQKGAQPAGQPRGSAEKLLEGCEALRALRDRCLAGKVPSHDEGIGLFTALMHTEGGIDWFAANVPGWAKTDEHWKQLNDLIDKNYSPWTCATMRTKGLCSKETECFEKRPPYKNENGRWVPDLAVPEAEWPSPSPMRYATATEDILKKLEEDAAALPSIKDHKTRIAALQQIALQSMDLDTPQVNGLRKILRNLKDETGEKLFSARELNGAFNKASAAVTQKSIEKFLEEGATVAVNANLYRRVLPHGYEHVSYVRETQKISQICSVDIEIEDVRSYVDDGVVTEKVYAGHCLATGEKGEVREAFEISTDLWEDNNEFKKYFAKLLGGHFNVVRQDIDLIRQAAMGFSKKEHYVETRSLMTQGWIGGVYSMPSCIVDKAGVRANTESPVHLAGKEHATRLDFKPPNEEELKAVLVHIRDEFLECWPRQWTTLTLAHTFIAALMEPLEITVHPAFFLEGESGTGKTQLTHMAQYFYGNFPKLLNMETSANGAGSNLYDFKDSLLVLDDFKGLSPAEITNIKKVIQYGYDANEASKLKRDGSYRKSKGNRGILMATGEHFVTAEASVVARTILVEVDRRDTRPTNEIYRRCMKMRKKYSVVTPYLIHSVLQKDADAIGADMTRVQTEIQDLIANRQNAPRIANNLAINHTVWRLFVEFMGEQGILSETGRQDYISEHRGYINELAYMMANRCEDEQASHVFMRVLRQLVLSGEVTIVGVNDKSMNYKQYKPTVGYVHENGNVVLYPDITFSTVTAASKHTPISASIRSIGEQFKSDGTLVAVDKNRTVKLMRHKGRKPERVWLMGASQFKDEDDEEGRTFSMQEHREKKLIRTVTNIDPDDDDGGIL